MGEISEPSDPGALAGDPANRPAPGGLTPKVIVYGVAPVALAIVLVCRKFGMVAHASVAAYSTAILGSVVTSRFVERWKDCGPRTWRMHARVCAHVAAVAVVIYLSGWGPALGMAFAFSALADLEQSGAKTWRAALGWSVFACAVGQLFVFAGWAPSMLDRTQSQAIGLLGSFVFAIVIRMAGATGEQKEHAEAMLAHRAWHDPLTGLPNREYLVDRLSHAIAVLDRHPHEPPAVMFLDLDRFKLVNDTFGHHAGDLLLVQVAERVSKVLRHTDTLARFGGDEFVILCEYAGDEDVERVADRVRAAFQEPFQIADDRWNVSVSIGIATLDADVTGTEELLSEADAAMYFAKAQGTAGKVRIFDEATRRAARRRVNTETELVHALERNELQLHYQPVVHIASRRLVGVEALLRWQHRDRGVLVPNEFLEAAERTGLIVPIGQWALETACTTVGRWNAARADDDQLHVALNLSPRQLGETDLIAQTRAILAATGIDPGALRLSFELTESFAVAREALEPDERSRLIELAALGPRLAIDDFGTGYASLRFVKDLPVSVLKVNHDFVRNLCDRPRASEIVRGVIELAHSIDTEVVADGVETDAQYAALAAMRCDYAQGGLLGPPQTADDLFTIAMA